MYWLAYVCTLPQVESSEVRKITVERYLSELQETLREGRVHTYILGLQSTFKVGPDFSKQATG